MKKKNYINSIKKNQWLRVYFTSSYAWDKKTQLPRFAEELRMKENINALGHITC